MPRLPKPKLPPIPPNPLRVIRNGIREGRGVLDGVRKEIRDVASDFTGGQRREAVPVRTSTQPRAKVATNCVACALGHYGTCTGILNEAMRFARSEGIKSDEVINRVMHCIDELNAMEREDLRPEAMIELSDWEKELADLALTKSRPIRHALEDLTSVGQLEKLAAEVQTTRTLLGKTYFKNKLDHLTPEDKVEVTQKVIDRLKDLADQQPEAP